MARVKTMGVSPITNTIYYGTVNTDKQMWVGNKTDVTMMAKRAVAEYLIGLNGGKYAFGMGEKFVVVSAEVVDKLPEEFNQMEDK